MLHFLQIFFQEINDINLLGIYDGHGGTYVSEYLASHIPLFYCHRELKAPFSREYHNKVFDDLQESITNFAKHIKDFIKTDSNYWNKDGKGISREEKIDSCNKAKINLERTDESAQIIYFSRITTISRQKRQ